MTSTTPKARAAAAPKATMSTAKTARTAKGVEAKVEKYRRPGVHRTVVIRVIRIGINGGRRINGLAIGVRSVGVRSRVGRPINRASAQRRHDKQRKSKAFRRAFHKIVHTGLELLRFAQFSEILVYYTFASPVAFSSEGKLKISL